MLSLLFAGALLAAEDLVPVGLQKQLLVDLGGVSYVDSAGLGEMVQAYATTKNRGGALKLVNVTKRLRDLLVVTKLVTVFDTFDDEASALASFTS